MLSDDIESYGAPEREATSEVWDLFKKLRRYGLERDQISILLRRFVLDMTMRQICAEMGWTSMQTLYRRYRKALATLKKRGFSK